MKICEYGCGQEANYQFKNGKWCCSKRFTVCPSVRKKNSESSKGKNTKPQSEEHKRKIGEANKGKPSWKKGIKTNPLSNETKKKISKAIRLTVEKINKRYPLFSKVEEIREIKNGDIQVHCKNHNCKNSKEKGGWFTPSYIQLYERVRQVESKNGNGGSHFYCCQECKDTCPLYNLFSDPLKENPLPYTPLEWNETRRLAWKRDDGLCRDCDKPGTDVHHIKPVKLEPFLALDIDNLITLCEECHKKYHEKGLINSTGNLAKVTCSSESQKFLNQK